MANFRYRGRSGRGALITGRLDGDDVDAVAARLLNLGITPLEIAPDAVHGTTVRDLLQRAPFEAVFGEHVESGVEDARARVWTGGGRLPHWCNRNSLLSIRQAITNRMVDFT